MTRWQRGEADVERLLADGELQSLTGAAADGTPWMSKAPCMLGHTTAFYAMGYPSQAKS